MYKSLIKKNITLNIDKCVHLINFAIIFNYNDIKYTSNMIRSLKSLMSIIILPLRLSLNKIFHIINIK